MSKCKRCGYEEKDFQLTESLNDIQKVIVVFKVASGFERHDKSWDKVFFPRYSRAAKELIEFMGNWKDAADCIQDTIERIKEWKDDASITLDGIIKNHAANWKKDRQEKNSRGEASGISVI